jgi:hypothetical protein
MTATLHGGSNPGLAQAVLQHSSARVGDEHYDSSSSYRAALELAAIIEELKQ